MESSNSIEETQSSEIKRDDIVKNTTELTVIPEVIEEEKEKPSKDQSKLVKACI